MKPRLKTFVPDPELKTYDLQYVESYKIPPNYGHGLKWKDADGRNCKSVLSDTDFTPGGKRIATLNESNLLFSLGASHYYAKIEAHGPGVQIGKTRYGMAGYGPERDALEGYLHRISIEAKRRLTKVEKDMSGERIGKIGDMTYRFNTPEEARATAIQMFKDRFAPGWVLVDGMDSAKIVAET